MVDCIEAHGAEQEMALFASVPLTGEDWVPLSRGEVLTAASGQLATSGSVRVWLVGSGAPLRARLLQRLLDPLGTLGLAAIAAGAFAGFLQRSSAEGLKVSVEDVSRYSSDQIAELVRFVAQVSPESLQEIANTFADNPVGITAFGTSVAVLLMRRRRRAEPAATTRPADADAPEE